MVDGIFAHELSALYGAFVLGKMIRWRVAGAVCGLCGMAAEVDGRRATAGTGGVLEEHAGGAPGLLELPRIKCGPGKGLCRGLYGSGVGWEVDGGVEGVEPAAWDDDVHDVAGGVGGAAGRLSGQQDVVIGTAAANRGRKEIEGLMDFS